MTVLNKVENSVIRVRCGVTDGLVTQIERGFLEWFGHHGIMNEGKLAKQIYELGVNGRAGVQNPGKHIYN